MNEEIADWFSNDMYEDIKEKTNELKGASLENFMSSTIFKNMIINTFIDNLNENSNILIESTKNLMVHVTEKLILKYCPKNFQDLSDVLSEVANSSIERLQEETTKNVHYLIKTEK